MKANLESSNMAGDEEKMQYVNQLKVQQEESSRQHYEEKKRLEALLKQEQEQVYALKSSNNCRVSIYSALTNELKQTKESLDQVTASKRELEAERTDNEQEVEAARQRLERVYSDMLSALQGMI